MSSTTTATTSVMSSTTTATTSVNAKPTPLPNL
jgi:hypothetical protein